MNDDEVIREVTAYIAGLRTSLEVTDKLYCEAINNPDRIEWILRTLFAHCDPDVREIGTRISDRLMSKNP